VKVLLTGVHGLLLGHADQPDAVGEFVASGRYPFCQAEPSALIQEGVRASYAGGWYADVLTELPRVERGYVSAPSGPGPGTALLPEFTKREDVMLRVSP
jgi:hypothetical protein